MANPTIQANDSGVLFTMSVEDDNGPVDLSTVQSIDLYFERPDGSTYSVPCDTVDGPGGIIRYISHFNDFTQAGDWNMQLVIRFADDTIRHSSIGTITVEPNIFSL